ncbi:hypothetical protein BKA67DRAFT_695302 [Truncatella angustata]|uniref:Uncharacterized protein n=1 Tax=Truncatella angustata TaxID=152316 RepID=A0A9P8RM45_9PEZI|nr:uncharacterized protein BKA67DRAFT_695302 [Truncatella angustata]KAH6646768.1 hypothetical protein BKA67DRAFT_695302 [Truncatella angustata]
MTDSQPCTVFRNSLTLERRNESAISSYCDYRLENGFDKCIILCAKRGRRYYATDLEIVQGEFLDVKKLRKHPSSGGWWKRYSLYSVREVRDVVVQVIECRFDASKPRSIEIHVVTRDMTNLESIDMINQAISEMVEEGFEPCECAIDINGDIHNESVNCANTTYNEFDDLHCRVWKLHELKRQRLEYQWMNRMTEYYWQNGIEAKGLEFLEKAGFIHTYEGLKFDQCGDAANPYGNQIKGFLIVEGWHIRYLLLLIAGSLLCGIVAVAIAAAVSQSLELAFTVGSYVCGLATALIAVFTLVSAIA